MAAFKTLDDLQAAGAARGLRVLVRLDLNVPMRDGRVTDQTRIMRAAPTVAELAANGARVVVLSHFGRPGGRAQKDLSLEPLAEALAEALGRPVGFSPDCIGAAAEAAVGALADGGVRTTPSALASEVAAPPQPTRPPSNATTTRPPTTATGARRRDTIMELLP